MRLHMSERPRLHRLAWTPHTADQPPAGVGVTPGRVEWHLAERVCRTCVGRRGGPRCLTDVAAGGEPASVDDQRRVLRRPPPCEMRPIAQVYVTYWVDRLGIDRMTDVIANSKDDDRVWAWYVGRQAELAALSPLEAR